MIDRLDKIKKAIEPLREQIINHKVYSAINNIEDLKIFMQYHVFAVWDFMSLLKTLQNNLTCTSVPWFPKGQADSRYLINVIVTAEEADIDSFGNRKSHFELYLDSMNQCGANTSQINKFMTELKITGDLKAAYALSEAPAEAREFVDFTFKIIESNQTYLQSAIFTFGREDLIPAMFLSLVNDIHKNVPDSTSIFKYYLERHISIDGDQHSDLAMQITSNLCGTNNQNWDDAEQATIKSLQQRINLWNGAYNEIMNSKAIVNNNPSLVNNSSLGNEKICCL